MTSLSATHALLCTPYARAEHLLFRRLANPLVAIITLQSQLAVFKCASSVEWCKHCGSPDGLHACGEWSEEGVGTVGPRRKGWSAVSFLLRHVVKVLDQVRDIIVV